MQQIAGREYDKSTLLEQTISIFLMNSQIHRRILSFSQQPMASPTMSEIQARCWQKQQKSCPFFDYHRLFDLRLRLRHDFARSAAQLHSYYFALPDSSFLILHSSAADWLFALSHIPTSNQLLVPQGGQELHRERGT